MTSAVGRAVTLLLVLVTLGGCASSRDANLRRSNLLIDAEGAAALDYVANWVTDIPVTRGSTVAIVKVLGDVVVVVERPSQLVTVLSVRDGHVLWRRAVAEPGDPVFPPDRHGDNIVINTGTRFWQFRIRDGEVMNAFDIERVATTGPLVVDDSAIFGSIDGTISAKSVDDGITQWQYRLATQIVAPPIRVDNNIFVTDADGTYAMLSPEAPDTFIWRGRTFAGIVAEPAADEANVYLPSRDGTLYALDRTTGRDQWPFRSETPLTLPPKSFDRVVLLPVPNRGVVALDAATGEVRWELEDVKTLAVTRRGDDAVLAGIDRLMLVDLVTGRVRAEAQTRTLAAIRPGPDDSLILASPSGRVMRINTAK